MVAHGRLQKLVVFLFIAFVGEPRGLCAGCPRQASRHKVALPPKCETSRPSFDASAAHAKRHVFLVKSGEPSEMFFGHRTSTGFGWGIRGFLRRQWPGLPQNPSPSDGTTSRPIRLPGCKRRRRAPLLVLPSLGGHVRTSCRWTQADLAVGWRHAVASLLLANGQG